MNEHFTTEGWIKRGLEVWIDGTSVIVKDSEDKESVVLTREDVAEILKADPTLSQAHVLLQEFVDLARETRELLEGSDTDAAFELGRQSQRADDYLAKVQEFLS